MSGRAQLPAGGVRFTVKLLNCPLDFRRYPIEVEPPEGLVGFINNASRQCAGVYRDGKWRDQRGKPITWEPTQWTVIDEQGEAL